MRAPTSATSAPELAPLDGLWAPRSGARTEVFCGDEGPLHECRFTAARKQTIARV